MDMQFPYIITIYDRYNTISMHDISIVILPWDYYWTMDMQFPYIITIYDRYNTISMHDISIVMLSWDYLVDNGHAVSLY